MTPNTILDAINAGATFIQTYGRSSSDLVPVAQSLITGEELLRQHLAQQDKVLVVHSLPDGTKCDLNGFSPEKQRSISQELRRYNLNAASANERISALAELARDPHDIGFVILLKDGDRCLPHSENGFLSEEQHILYERVSRLGETSSILKTKNTVIIEADLGTLDPQIEQAATPIVWLHADQEEIAAVIDLSLERFPNAQLEEGLTTEHAARLLSHTPTINVVKLIRGSYLSGDPVTTEQLKRQKQETIERQSEGILTVLEPRENVVLVGDYLEPVKRELTTIFRLLAQGHKDTPLYVVLSGPPGVGKTVLVTQLAHEAGIPVFELQSMLSKWQGEAQRISKKVHAVRKEQWPNGVIADENRNISTQRESDHDGGTTAELNRDWLSKFTDATMRGRSTIFSTTNVPDTLPAAMKSKAEFIPVFSPGLSDLETITAHLSAKYEFALDRSSLAEAASILHAKMASPRDIENMLRRLRRHQAPSEHVLLAADDLLIPENNAQATILCDLNNLQVMNGRSALPWRDRKAMPAHIASCLDDDGRINADVVRRRLESLSHVRV